MGARQYVIDAESVERRAAAAPRGGRRLSASDAWGVIALAAGEDATWLDRRSRYRLRQLLERRGLSGLRSRLVARAAVVRLRAHPSELKAVKSDDAIVLSGSSAASGQRLGLLAVISSTAMSPMVIVIDWAPMTVERRLCDARATGRIAQLDADLAARDAGRGPEPELTKPRSGGPLPGLQPSGIVG